MPEAQKSLFPWLRLLSILATLLIAVAAFAAGFFLRGGELASPSTVVDQTQADAAEAWPTIPPTFTPLATATPLGPAPTATPIPLPEWTELGHLSSIRFNSSTIVTEQRQQLLGSDKLVIVVAADVLMGVDLSKIKQEDVKLIDRHLQLTLPRPIVTSIELRLQDSQIYDANKAWIWSDYSGLETTAIERAQRQLHDHAINNQSMIELTEMVTKLQLGEFLEKTGFEKVEILFKKNELPDEG